MKFKAVTTDEDRGWRNVLDAARQMKKRPHVDIGILDLEADDPKRQRPGQKASGRVPTLAQVATWMEFGTAHSPPRSFIRATVNENERIYDRLIEGLKMRVLKSKMPVHEALGLLGQKIQADIINRINAGIGPALSKRTEKAKGSSKPLIDTGQLKQSIRYRVISDSAVTVSPRGEK